MNKKKQNIAVLGAGFIGGNLVRHLKEDPSYDIRLLVHKNIPDLISSSRNMKIFWGDICKVNSFKDMIEDNDIVINLTGQFRGYIRDFSKVNLIGAQNIVDIGKEKKIKKIIHISSVFVYGDLKGTEKSAFKEDDKPKPIDAYSKIKLRTEKVFEKFSDENKIRVIILRLTNVYGPRGKGVINKLVDANKQKKEFVINNDGNQIRDYIYIDDVVAAILKSINLTPNNNFEIINISNNCGIRLREIIDYINKEYTLKIRYKKTMNNEIQESIINNEKAKKLLKFKPKIEFFKGVDLLLNQT